VPIADPPRHALHEFVVRNAVERYPMLLPPSTTRMGLAITWK